MHGANAAIRAGRTEQRNSMMHALATATAGPLDEAVGRGMPGTSAVTFDDLIDRYQSEIYRFVTQLTRNRADADDLYQDTLMKAYRAFGRLDCNANHRAWLYKIATNTFLSDRRKRSREDPLMDGAEDFLPAATVDSVSQLDARDLLAEVEGYILNLPPKQRIALILRKYHELGYDEIAANLDSSEAAARANVHEALRKLRDCFGDRL
jgi:RNA polymerase sigma-70 factor (ECF subfamily)